MAAVGDKTCQELIAEGSKKMQSAGCGGGAAAAGGKLKNLACPNLNAIFFYFRCRRRWWCCCPRRSREEGRRARGRSWHGWPLRWRWWRLLIKITARRSKTRGWFYTSPIQTMSVRSSKITWSLSLFANKLHKKLYNVCQLYLIYSPINLNPLIIKLSLFN
jgi:hypothetical protein